MISFRRQPKVVAANSFNSRSFHVRAALAELFL
jgi:hypothetical protein